MSVVAAKSNFFSANHYAVVGASKDPSKIGNKVVKWYKERGFKPIPIHPKETSVEDLSTISGVSDLKDPTHTSLSVITPPKVTLPVLKTVLQQLEVTGVWIQPGAEDAEVIAFLDTCSEDVKRKVVLGGPCILVEGDALAKEKGKL